MARRALVLSLITIGLIGAAPLATISGVCLSSASYLTDAKAEAAALKQYIWLFLSDDKGAPRMTVEQFKRDNPECCQVNGGVGEKTSHATVLDKALGFENALVRIRPAAPTDQTPEQVLAVTTCGQGHLRR